MGLDTAPSADSTFQGAPAKTINTVQTFKKNGALIDSATGTTYFQTNPFKVLGNTYVSGELEIFSNQGTLPANAQVGDSGYFARNKGWSDSSQTTLDNYTFDIRWELQADTANTAYFCLNHILAAASGIYASNPTDTYECYKIDGNGNILGFRLTQKINTPGNQAEVTFKS